MLGSGRSEEFCAVNVISNEDGIYDENDRNGETPIPSVQAEFDREEIESLKHEIKGRFDFVYPDIELTRLPAKLSVSELYPGVLDEEGYEDSDGALSDDIQERDLPLFMSENADLSDGRKRGNATHIFMQFCDFRRVDLYGVDEEIARLVTDRYITSSDAALIYRDRLRKFFDSALYSELRRAEKIWREIRFNIRFPAEEFTLDKSRKKQLEGEYILVQGVIDCFFVSADGKITLIDYKTDYIPNNMSRSDAEKMLAERHGRQLSYYRIAVRQLTGIDVGRVLIYSFGLGDTVELPF